MLNRIIWTIPVCCSFGVVYLGVLSTEAMRESPSKARSHQPISRQKHLLTNIHLDELISTGIIVIDDVLSADELILAQNEVKSLINSEKNVFEENDNKDKTVRQDIVNWIAESIGDDQNSNIGPGLLCALRCVRAIPYEFTSDLRFDSANLGVPLANQLACYKGNGAHYIPHRDTPESGTSSHPLRWLLQPGLEERRYTIILYLNNADWNGGGLNKNSSGNLRCYMNADMDDTIGSTATSILNIEPKGGRMVIFDSVRILHEVVPTFQDRTALTCWVGGSHSRFVWMRVLCIPTAEINWKSVKSKFI